MRNMRHNVQDHEHANNSVRSCITTADLKWRDAGMIKYKYTLW